MIESTAASTNAWSFIGVILFNGFTRSINDVTLEDVTAGHKGPIAVHGTSG